ncbi:MAG TPA: TIGR00282 family metallophosphoesterase [Planctomycetota bacterium]|nr:TIGR00282 family metallophosphoesterase [Planctomycetota bacterium]
MRILGIGDIVGSPGRKIIADQLGRLRQERKIDFVVANAENATGGSGITPEHATAMLAQGVDVLTGGDHVWGKKEIIPFIAGCSRLLRPANYPDSNPGAGYTIADSPQGPVGVVHVVGRIFMTTAQAGCPFTTAETLAKKLRERTPVIVVDLHAEATSEKMAFGWHMDGLASFIFGTHTHIQTADERVLPKGTAYITDAGMTGPYESVIGRRIDRVLHKMITQMPAPFDVAEGDARICGAIATVDPKTGRASAIERVVVFENGAIR